MARMTKAEKIAAENLNKATAEYLARQARSHHPVGTFDKQGRWTPSDEEECSCCSSIRRPSGAYPLSLNKHCRSVEHVAELFGVDARELRKAARKDSPLAEHVTAYKLVALTDEGLASVYSGESVEIGKCLVEAAKPDHEGGYFVRPTLELALRASFPKSSKLRAAPKAVVRCECWGKRIVYESGKLAFTYVKPVAIVAVLATV